MARSDTEAEKLKRLSTVWGQPEVRRFLIFLNPRVGSLVLQRHKEISEERILLIFGRKIQLLLLYYNCFNSVTSALEGF